MFDFGKIMTLIYNIIMSIISPFVQFPFNILITIYNTLDAIVGGIINAFDIYNEDNNINNTDEE